MLDEVATAITADAAAQQSALRRGTPRNAIVECWLRLEAAVVAAGVPRRPADTSTDLMLRVMAARPIDPTAIANLAALYREARFSDHPMTEDSRREAIDALVKHVQQRVTGVIRMRFYKGEVRVIGRQSPFADVRKANPTAKVSTYPPKKN